MIQNLFANLFLAPTPKPTTLKSLNLENSSDYSMYSTFLTASSGSVLFSRSNLLKRKDLCFSSLRLGLIRPRRSLRSSHLSSQVCHDSHRVTLEKAIRDRSSKVEISNLRFGFPRVKRHLSYEGNEQCLTRERVRILERLTSASCRLEWRAAHKLAEGHVSRTVEDHCPQLHLSVDEHFRTSCDAHHPALDLVASRDGSNTEPQPVVPDESRKDLDLYCSCVLKTSRR